MVRFHPSWLLLFLILSLSSVALFCPQASAGVVIGGTRFIYGEMQHSITVSVHNKGKNAYLINSRVSPGGDWPGSEMPTTKTAPFVVTPPLFMLKPNKENSLRIIQTDLNLPKDKESLFTLDIASIPSGKSEPNSVQIAVRTKLKLFYRPAHLKGNPQQAYMQLRWHQEENSIVIDNPSPYFVTLFRLSANGVPIDNAGMVPPLGSRKVNWCHGSHTCQLSWQSINDYGRVMPAISLTVSGTSPVSAISEERK